MEDDKHKSQSTRRDAIIQITLHPHRRPLSFIGRKLQRRENFQLLNTQPGSLVMAHEELKRNFEGLKDICEKLESRVRYHETKVLKIIFGSFSSGRLFFFGISQISSSFKCNDWWVILAVSLLCTLVYFLLFLDAVTMLDRIQHQLDMIYKELTEICQKISVATNQDDVGLSMEAGESSDGFEFGFHEKMLMLDHFRIVGRKAYIYFTVCALLAVTALESYACKHLLCN